MAETTKEKPELEITDEILAAGGAPESESEDFHLMLEALEQLGARLTRRGFDRGAWTTAVVCMASRLAYEDLGPSRASQWLNDCAAVIAAAGIPGTMVQ